MEKSAHKLELLKRIAELEKQELWHLDVEDDPETYPLMPDKIDYLNEKLSSKIKNKIAKMGLIEIKLEIWLKLVNGTKAMEIKIIE